MVFRYKTKIILFKIFIDLFAEKREVCVCVCVCVCARVRECVRVKKIWIIKQIVL